MRREFVRLFVERHHDAADVALLAGSRARGEGTDTSDYDVVLVFRDLPDGAWRRTTMFDGRCMEVFAHDLQTLAYFCREVDRPSGKPILPSMVFEGIPVLCRAPNVLEAARAICSRTLALGPPPLGEDTAALRRYAITDLATATDTGRPAHVRLAAGAALYGELADFALRSVGRWSGSAKALPRELARLDADLALWFEAAFASLFASGDDNGVHGLVDDVLAPHGGRLREGFSRVAPAAWRETG